MDMQLLALYYCVTYLLDQFKLENIPTNILLSTFVPL